MDIKAYIFPNNKKIDEKVMDKASIIHHRKIFTVNFFTIFRLLEKRDVKFLS